MSDRMKKHLRASWLIFATTPDDPPAGDPPAGDPPATDPPAGDPPAPSDGGGDPPADPDPGDGKTPLALDQIPEGMRSLFEGIETQEDLAAKLKGPEIPEAYTIPEAMADGKIDAATMEEFTPLAKELGLDQAAVEKLLAFDVARMEKMSDGLYDRVLDLQAQGYKSELDKVKETMGADKFDVAHQQAVKTIEAVASAEIMTELKATGLIDSPLMFKLGQEIYQKLMKEDGPPPPSMPVKDGIRAGDPETAKGFYTRMNKGEGTQAQHGKP